VDFLTGMVRERRERMHRDERRVSTAELRDQAEARAGQARRFLDALRRGSGDPIRAIAEVKRMSPSAGVLRAAYDPVALAGGYERAGAAAISVLTEPDRFGGSAADLSRVRERVRVPVLWKDFVVHERQIYEASASGADAVLLIVAALGEGQLADFASLVGELGMTPLVEVLEAREIDRAIAVDGAAIGVNNRDLRTLEMRSGWAEKLLAEVPADRVRVAESGYKKPTQVEAAERLGIDAILVGESLLTEESPEVALRDLLGDRRSAGTGGAESAADSGKGGTRS
jgi:indole-3-glycerol phosphate synthase